MAETFSVEAYLKATDSGFAKEFENAQKTVGKFKTGVGNVMAKIGPIVAQATKAAGVALVAFSAYGIKSAADLQVVEAQYSQSFEGVSKEADTMVKSMSKSFNILPERLKAPMSSFQSYFKGTGMEVNKSLEATEKAMTLAADSSAYYDKSIEDTSMSLKGMMMGNYENGDAIGINTNATKIAAAYNEKYGGSFEDLADAQKQNYILEYVEDIYTLSGVMGQSEREGKSFENVFSNLKSSLSTFAAKVMEPFMEPLINAMQRAGEWMTTADEKFFAFMETIQNSTAFQSLQTVIQTAIDKVKEFGESEAWATIVTAFEDLGQAILDIDFVKLSEDIQAFLDKWGPLIAGVAAGVASFKLITATVALFSAGLTILSATMAAVTAAGGLMAFAMGLLASPVLLAALAIAALVAIGVLLWQNWDTIKAKLGELKDKFIADWEELKTIVSAAMTALKDAALEDFEELKTGITTAVKTLKDAAIEDFNELKTIGSNAVETLKTAAIADATELSTGATNAIETLRSAAISDFEELKTTGSNAMETLKSAAVSDAEELKSGAVGAIEKLRSSAITDFNELKDGGIRAWNSLKTKTTEIFNNVKDTITSAFDGIDLFSAGKAIIEGFSRGLKSAYEGVKSFVGGIAGWIEAHKGPISYDRKLLIGAGNAIMEGLNNGLQSSFKDVQSTVGGMAGQLNNTFSNRVNTLDVAGNVKSLNGSVNQSINHIVSDNLMNDKQPAAFTLNLGNRSFRAFVDDITNTQNSEIQLVEIYL